MGSPYCVDVALISISGRLPIRVNMDIDVQPSVLASQEANHNDESIPPPIPPKSCPQ